MLVRLFLLLIAAPSLSWGSDYRESAQALKHEIVAVTTYSDQAEVVRAAPVNAPKGQQWVRLRGLPANLDRGSLKVDLSSSRGKILQVVLEQSFEHVALNPQIRQQLAQLKKQLALLLDLTQQQRNRTREIGFLKNLKFEPPFPKGTDARAFESFSAGMQSLGNAFQTLRSSIASAQNAEQTDRKKIEELEKDIDHQIRQLQGVTQTNEQKWIGNLYVLVESDQKWNGKLTTNYRMDRAQWTPLYDVRADLNRQKGTANIKLVTAGLIEQHTGEDWKQVRLKVSTRDPAPLWLPPMDRWVLGENRIEQVEMEESRSRGAFGGSADSAVAPPAGSRMKSARGRSQLAQKPAPKVGLDDSSEGSAADLAAPAEAPSKKWSPSQRNTVAELFPLQTLEQMFPKYGEVKRSLASMDKPQHRAIPLAPSSAPPGSLGRLAAMAGGRVLEMDSPFDVDLASDEAPVKVPLNSEVLQGKLQYFAIPKVDPRVYLRAKTKNATKQPILAGQAQIFMNGDLITKTSLPTVAEKGFFEVDLGIDENVETKRTVKKTSETTGILSKSHETRVTVELEVANHHPFPIQLRLRDQHPLSPGEDVELKLLQTQPKIQAEPTGILTWNAQVKAKSRQKFSFVYYVKHPENMLVSEFN